MGVYLYSEEGELGQIASRAGFDEMIAVATKFRRRYPGLYQFFETGRTRNPQAVQLNIRQMLRREGRGVDKHVQSSFQGLAKKLSKAKEVAIASED
jgi:hypothetical protein